MTSVYVCVYIYIYIYMRVCVDMSMYIYICVCMYADTCYIFRTLYSVRQSVSDLSGMRFNLSMRQRCFCVCQGSYGDLATWEYIQPLGGSFSPQKKIDNAGVGLLLR